ncbi:hypothetical protein HK102_000158 [Quaeritorhiza haematococci]|nr:hypothetical protein HK102_000158 [Quaeritorhiza haematococci]
MNARSARPGFGENIKVIISHGDDKIVRKFPATVGGLRREVSEFFEAVCGNDFKITYEIEDGHTVRLCDDDELVDILETAKATGKRPVFNVTILSKTQPVPTPPLTPPRESSSPTNLSTAPDTSFTSNSPSTRDLPLDLVGNTFDVMLSYQWDAQQKVIAIRDALKERGLSVWMDVDLMKGDIYFKMAEAVLNSTVVAPCLTAKYEVGNFPAQILRISFLLGVRNMSESHPLKLILRAKLCSNLIPHLIPQKSANCQRELKYAADIRKAIVPARLEQNPNYRFTWAGLITSGLIYIDVANLSPGSEAWKTHMDTLASEVCIRIEDKKQADATKPLQTAPSEADELREWLKPVDFADHVKEYERSYVEGTRGWLLDMIRKWLSAPEADGETHKVMWLNGGAGVGKSLMAWLVAKELSTTKELVSEFYCQHNDNAKNNPHALVNTVAYNLAQWSPEIRLRLMHLCEEDKKKKTEQSLLEGPINAKFRALILEPLKGLSSPPPSDKKIVIVLDALDECGQPRSKKRMDLLRLLGRECRELPSFVKLFVTGRPEEDLWETLHALDMTELETTEAENLNDLQIYAQHRLQRHFSSPANLKKGVAAMSAAADGLFVWTKIAADEIDSKEPGRDEDALHMINNLQKGVDGIYHRLLRDALGDSSNEDFQLVVGTMCTLKRPLTQDALAHFLNIGKGRLAAVLLQFRFLISIHQEGTISFMHKSATDYLTSFDRCEDHRFHIDTKAFSIRTAKRCLEVMRTTLDADICGLNQEQTRGRLHSEITGFEALVAEKLASHLQYSCKYWIAHVLDAAEPASDPPLPSDVLELVSSVCRNHLLHWIEVMSLLGDFSFAVSEVQRILVALRPRDIAAIVEDKASAMEFRVDDALLMAISAELEQDYIRTFGSVPEGDTVAETISRQQVREDNRYRNKEAKAGKWKKKVSSWFRKPRPKNQSNPATSPVDSPPLATSTLESVLPPPAEAPQQQLPAIESPKTKWSIACELLSDCARLMEYFQVPISQHALQVYQTALALCPKETQIWRFYHPMSPGHTQPPSYSFPIPRISVGALEYWDACMAVIELPSTIKSIAYSPDGSSLAVASAETISLIDVRTQSLLRILRWQRCGVEAVAFSPDGRRIASGCDDGTVRVWDTETDAELYMMERHSHAVRVVIFSSDGLRVASASWDDTVHVWDARTGAVLRKMPGNSSGVRAMAFSPDLRRVASGSWMMLRVWDSEMGTMLREMEENEPCNVEALAFSPDGQRVVAGCGNGTIRVHNIETGAVLCTMQGHTHGVKAVTFSHDGRRVASVSDDRKVHVWNVKTGTVLHSMQGHSLDVQAVAFSPDGQRVVSGSDDGTVRIWDVAMDATQRTMQGQSSAIEAVAFSRDRRRLASGCGDGSVRIWDTETGAILCTMEEHYGRVLGVAFSPNGKRVASGSFDNTVRVWDVETGVSLHIMQGHTSGIEAVAFSPDGQEVVSGSYDTTVRLWDTQTGVQLCMMEGHRSGVEAVAFSPDGSRIASGSWDDTVRVWDVKTGTLLHTIEGHNSRVFAVTFSPDGRYIAAGLWDKAVCVWDAETENLLHTMQAHSREVNAVMFSSDGKQIASASLDGTVRLWDAKTGATVGVTVADELGMYLDELGWVHTRKEGRVFWIPSNMRGKIELGQRQFCSTVTNNVYCFLLP